MISSSNGLPEAALTEAIKSKYNWINEAYGGVVTKKYDELVTRCVALLGENSPRNKFPDYILYKVELVNGGKGVAI